MPQIEIMSDVRGVPHTFIMVYHPDGKGQGYGFAPLHEGRPVDTGHIYDDTDHPYSISSGRIDITDEQYADLMYYINDASAHPPDYNIYLFQQCTVWVNSLLLAAGITPPSFLNTIPNIPYTEWLDYTLGNFVRNLFNEAATIPPPSSSCPIVFDLNGDGVMTTGVKDGAYFDNDGNGFAEQTGWASSDDGILVRDRNGDGIINDGNEVFGDQTLLQNGQPAANGFEALAELDTNTDGKIDANDAVWSQLKVWQDWDGDGYSASDELFTLDELGIQSINISYTTSTYVDENGNEHQQVGSYTKTDGSTLTTTDVWFQTDPTYTIADEWLDVPTDIAALPDLQAYGNTYNLHQAMDKNELRRAA